MFFPESATYYIHTWTMLWEWQLSPDGNYVLVTGFYNTESVAVVDVTTKTSPVVRGGVTGTTYYERAAILFGRGTNAQP